MATSVWRIATAKMAECAVQKAEKLNVSVVLNDHDFTICFTISMKNETISITTATFWRYSCSTLNNVPQNYLNIVARFKPSHFFRDGVLWFTFIYMITATDSLQDFLLSIQNIRKQATSLNSNLYRFLYLYFEMYSITL